MTHSNPTPVVVALLRCGTGLLVVQRAILPKLGEWAFPGGYVNEGEDAETAICREVHEETGFSFDAELWHPVKTSITPNNKLLIFMSCSNELYEDLLEQFVPNSEVSAVKIANVKDELCFPLHTKMLKAVDIW